MKEQEPILLRPCMGRRDLGNIPAHIYLAITEDMWYTKEGLGWFTEEEAKERFGAEHIEIIESHTVCPKCLVGLFA